MAGVKCTVTLGPSEKLLTAIQTMRDVEQSANETVSLLARLEYETCDLRCVEDRGHDDSSYHWFVIEHYMEKPRERTLGQGATAIEALRDAFGTEAE